jgi:hypothetical protein
LIVFLVQHPDGVLGREKEFVGATFDILEKTSISCTWFLRECQKAL